jgi:U6 snRNA-associated Sm-like protein LSm2
VKHCFVRGSVIRYVQLPKADIDVELLQDATRKEAQQQRAAK